MTATVMGDVSSLSSIQLAERLRANEAARRALDVADHAVLNEIACRGTYAEFGCRDAKTYVATVLRIPASEAGARLKVAAATGPRRRPFTGEDVGPVHPEVAAALAEGAITARAALAITGAVDSVPAHVLDQYSDGVQGAVEHELVEFSRLHDAAETARFAHGLCLALDHDGALDSAELWRRRRALDARRRPDGSGRLEADLTAEAMELLETMLDATSAPAPADDGTPDPRSAAQRRHDGLVSGLKLLLDSGRLPASGGCRTTVVLTMDAGDFAGGRGVARTGHGYSIPMSIAKQWLEPEARAILVLLSATRGIEAYSTTQRLFTEQQRLAMAARDRGCSYPGCDAPPAWTQAHHVTDWQATHRTSVDDGALVCAADHRAFERMGWTSVMRNGRPHWIPPDWVDPDRTPRRNRRHD